MKLTERKNKIQLWEVGDVISDGHSIFMIGFDHIDEKFRLISVYEGTILTEKYNSIRDMRITLGDFNPVAHAELVYSE
jgi:hypothetical protein